MLIPNHASGVLDFKFLVPAVDYQRILNFPYMKSQAELDDFTLFIISLGIKKIQGKFYFTLVMWNPVLRLTTLKIGGTIKLKAHGSFHASSPHNRRFSLMIWRQHQRQQTLANLNTTGQINWQELACRFLRVSKCKSHMEYEFIITDFSPWVPA